MLQRSLDSKQEPLAVLAESDPADSENTPDGDTQPAHSQPQPQPDPEPVPESASTTTLTAATATTAAVTAQPQPASDYPPQFEQFWQAYRRHGNKKQAHTAWRTALKHGHNADWLTSHAASYHAKADQAGLEMRYRKHAATWLRNDGWNDTITPRAPTSLLTRSQQAAATAMQQALAERNQQTPTVPPLAVIGAPF